jgi:two-component system nitrate/nitrite response regulator NarL
MKTSIYIADDHQIVIDGLMLLMRNEEQFIISGIANDGQKAIEEISKFKPNIALLDLRMPKKDGLEVTRYIKEHQLPTKVIILSMHGDRRYINDARAFGADGYLLKNTGKQELLKAIEEVLKGKTYFTQTKDEEQSQPNLLTPREMDILKLIVNEQTNAEIATKLKLSLFTVETHRRNLMKKIGAKNTAGLIKFAIEQQIPID